MNNPNDYFNYFEFLKNLKKTPDTGMSPLIEWNNVIYFFARIHNYIEIEWDINLDERLAFMGCKVDDYPDIHRQRRAIADIVVNEFRKGNNVSNTAFKVIDHLKQIGVYSPPRE